MDVDVDGAAMLEAGQTDAEVEAALDERKRIGQAFVYSVRVTGANGEPVVRLIQWTPQPASGSFSPVIQTESPSLFNALPAVN